MVAEGLVGVLDGVRVALDVALAVPLYCRRADDVADGLLAVQAIRAQAEALACSYAQVVSDQGLPAAQHLRTVGAFADARGGGVDPRAVNRDVLLGSWLADYPLLQAGFETGGLTRRHLEAIRCLDNKRTRPHIPASQQTFLDTAANCTWVQFVQMLRYWELAFDPDGEEPVEHAEKRFERHRKHLDGSVSGSFRLDPIAGQAFITAMDQETSRLHQQEEQEQDGEGDKQSDGEAGGGLVGSDGEPVFVSAAQRRADAFANLIARGAAREDGSLPAPLVHLVIGQTMAEAMWSHTTKPNNEHPSQPGPKNTAGRDNRPAEHEDEAEPDQPADPTVEPDPTAEPDRAPQPPQPQPSRAGRLDRLPIAWDDIDGRCELIDGTPVHPAYAIEVLGIATLRRLVLGAESEILDLGRAIRTFPAKLKAALLVAGRGQCAQPGCDTPVTWLQADHIMPWSRTGHTATRNGQTLCAAHNKTKRDQLPDG